LDDENPIQLGQDPQQWGFASDLAACLAALRNHQDQRAAQWQRMGTIARESFWWPFTQHAQAATNEPVLIDDAYGGHLSVVTGLRQKASANNAVNESVSLRPTFDGSASWWTLGAGHGNPTVAAAVAHAVGRYGHVLFPGQAHAPAAQLCELLLDGVGRGWADRVFFSDNGSTANEVALKMAFRLAESRGILDQRHKPLVLGLTDSYHGDTLAVCNATNPNIFKAQDRWYTPSGIWITPPRLLCVQGTWQLFLPKDYPSGCMRSYLSMDDVLACQNRMNQDPELVSCYRSVIDKALHDGLHRLGCLLIEPVVHGSGGMVFVDPLFQHLLVIEAKSQGIPVIFDEVFSGFWRLGAESARHLLAADPDIACYSKALTGGVLPLAVTLASHETFVGFLHESKEQALLHGHSYTAHPSGCAAAVAAITLYEELKRRKDLVQGYWDTELVQRISGLPGLEGIMALGTVIAAQLKGDDQGYASCGADPIMTELQKNGVAARSLGSVIYLMTYPLALRTEANAALEVFANVLEKKLRI
jgi:dethiobiotin synthetase/adenosylmethionine--8-amino-7-oxononanoate aminotransferase